MFLKTKKTKIFRRQTFSAGHREVDAKLPSLNMEPKRPETLSKGRKVSFLSKGRKVSFLLKFCIEII